MILKIFVNNYPNYSGLWYLRVTIKDHKDIGAQMLLTSSLDLLKIFGIAPDFLSVCAPNPQAREQLFKLSGSWSKEPGFNFIWFFVNHIHLFSLCKDNTFFEYKKIFLSAKLGDLFA